MLMASGANFGVRRTLPHMAGVGLGFPAMCFCVGLGVMRLFDLWAPAYTILTVLSVAYMLYLAWKIANAAPPEAESAPAPQGRPLTFLQAAAFQWVNPKAWSMALSAITLYAPGRTIGAVMWVVGAYVLCSVISTTSWTTIGRALKRFLQAPRRLRLFNWTMAGLLVVSMLPVLLG